MIKYHSINGEIVAADKASIPINDVGLLRGYGIFDFFPIREGLPLFEEDYFNRFYRSAKMIDLQVPIERDELKERVVDLARRNDLRRAYTKLVLTGGFAPDGYTPTRSNLYVLQHPDVQYNPRDYDSGVRLLMQRHARQQPEVKNLNYANVLQHRQILKQQNALDILYHDGRTIHETSRANFFLVGPDQTIYTSAGTALQGVTRRHVIKVARDHGLRVIEGPLPLYKILEASEAFITSTTKSVLPVTKLNDLVIGDGSAGPVSRKLFALFEKYMERCTGEMVTHTAS